MVCAVAQHGDAVAEAEDLVHLVRDVDDRDAALLQVAQSSRKSRSTASSKSELVGSSMSRMRAFMLSARAMASSCRCPIESDSTRRPARNRAPPVEERPAEAVDGSAGIAEIADDDVLAGGEGREQVELLVDDADAEPLRVLRIADADRLSVDRDPRAIGRRSRPARMRASVLLPAPFSPISAWTSPRRREKRRRAARRRRRNAW